MLLVELINKVEENFSNKIFDKYISTWDTERFYFQLKNVANNWNIENHTDFNYSNCNKYRFVEKEFFDKIYVIDIWISYIVDVFTISIYEQRKHNIKLRKIQKSSLDEKHHVLILDEKLHAFFKIRNFTEMKDDWYTVIIPSIKLELSSIPYLGKILFEDSYSTKSDF
jgi:hypothetical protein